MRKLIGGMAVVAVLMSLPAVADAQRRAAPRRQAAAQRPSFGVQASFGTETDFGIGGRVVFGLRSLFPAAPLEAHVGFDYVFPDEPAGVDLTYWEINGNVAYRIRTASRSLAPYVGGGLSIAHASVDIGTGSVSDTDVGLNLFGGTTFGSAATRVKPFAEARVTLGGGDQFVITGGVRF
jgi:opacity protein-like surface antigen